MACSYCGSLTHRAANCIGTTSHETRQMLIGDLLTWALDENREVVDQGDYEAWCAATINWSFGHSQSDAGGDSK